MKKSRKTAKKSKAHKQISHREMKHVAGGRVGHASACPSCGHKKCVC